MYNLCAFSPGNVRAGLSGFYREVLEAWDKILPYLRPDCKGKEHVLKLPFLSSPFITWKSKPLLSSHLREAGRKRNECMQKWCV